MLSLYTTELTSSSKDWTGNRCMYVTAYSVSIAKRIANNISEHLKSLKDLNEIKGNEKDFNLEMKTIIPDRVLFMAVYAAKIITMPYGNGSMPYGNGSLSRSQSLIFNPDTPLPSGKPYILSIEARNQNAVKTYYQSLISMDPDTIHTFKVFIDYQNVGIDGQQHVSRKIKVFGCC
jgi:hypothetical protein